MTNASKSKLDSNLLVISPDRTSLPTLLKKSFRMFDAELERTEIEASIVIEDGYRDLDVDLVMLDSSRVLQVVINLLTNSIKFTAGSAEKRITIFLNATTERPLQSNRHAAFIDQRPGRPDQTHSAEWGSGEQIFLQIAVQDSGKGLTDEELKLLFHRFQQASPKTYKQYGGSGLGLFISKELTELLDGQIGVSSKAGKGSTFTFYVKARRAVGPDAHAAVNNLELNPLSAAPSPPPTRASLSRASSYEPEQGPGGPPKARRGSHMARRTSSSNKVATQRQSLSVLVVEDNEINQRVMATQLRRLGCTVYTAGNGLEALEFLQRTTLWNPFIEGFPACADPVRLGVILMDVEMPVLGGLGCVRRIRELQVEGQLLKHVPVIAVTANARSEQIAFAIEAGMDSVVTKPFRIPELVPQMEALVERLQKEHGA